VTLYLLQRCAFIGAALCAVACAPHAQAQTDPVRAFAFDISVRAPAEFDTLRQLVEKHIELQRYRAVTDLDDAELARLIALTEQDVRALVGTLGYFNPVIRIEREEVALRPVIAINITPGPATTVANTRFNLTGDIASSQDVGVQAQKNSLQSNWLLPSGQRFTQTAWDNAKTQALRDLVSRRYPAGRLTDSLADIDPATSQANLSLTLDSGPLYRLGPLQVTGVSRYNPVLVPRLAQLSVGAVYDQKALIEAQRRIGASGYFDAATVLVDTDSDPLAAPVQIQVREARLQKVVLGLGASTDSGPRVSLEHTHNKAAGTDWRAVTKLQLEKKAPSLQTEWTSLPDEANWRWVGLGRAERFDDNALVTTAQRLRFGRTQQTERIDRNIYVQYERARVAGSGLVGNTNADTGDGSAVSANYVWTGRYFDSLPFPRKGYGLGFEVGGGFTLSAAANAKRQPFTRGVARWLGIHTLDGSRIAMRLEAGAVLARDAARVPSTSLFRTGGDSTVRGYGYRDIGIKLPSGVIGPGRYVAVSSVEWQRPIKSNGLPTDWENTLFIDAGGVADRPQELRASVGIGTGVRFKSPIGPLQIDLAYGVKTKQLRLHTTVGFVF
jgi:translocation and assembly module TamA